MITYLELLQKPDFPGTVYFPPQNILYQDYREKEGTKSELLFYVPYMYISISVIL